MPKKNKERYMTVLGGYRLDMQNSGRLVREFVQCTEGDYGADPLGDGMFRMVPSGDIVNFEERNKRLNRSKGE